jgi:ADP-dependent NAD(P)H-hydrate dehydratase
MVDRQVLALNDDALRAWPLPVPDNDGDKEERGRVLVVAGGPELAGAAVLAGTAALRAGAGKLVIATAASVAAGVGIAVPEARVIAMAETPGGGFALDGFDPLAQCAEHCDAVLLGPGLQDEAATCALVAELLPRLHGTPVVLDALAMNVVRTLGRFVEPPLLTPHAGEMAHLRGADKDAVNGEALAVACDAACRWNAIVALKGARTQIAAPDGRAWCHEGGNVGLATSGSGDVLAGLIAGLAARGALLEQACAWGVRLHALAGQRLVRRHGPLGALAREFAGEVPALLHALGGA